MVDDPFRFGFREPASPSRLGVTAAFGFVPNPFPDEQKVPFDIQSIEVDGGNELRQFFEQACENLALPLYVVPPRRPDLNGHVERENVTSKFEFYSFYKGLMNLTELNRQLEKFQFRYNHYRPHQFIDMMTPNPLV